jgi:sterol desaturase/sphingolipid hydroxylase (fatty acid hydroxylase superfamily)
MRLMGLPMGFFDWWICHEYVVYTEMFGHSGLRVWTTPATTATPLLHALGAELVTEDHDMHHRQGWKKSANYGKQTHLWDKVFGTMGKRVEFAENQIDWNSPVTLPW